MTAAEEAVPLDLAAEQRQRADEVRRCLQAEKRAIAAAEMRTRALRVSVVKALAANVPATELAEILGVSRQRVYQMRDETQAQPAARPASPPRKRRQR